MQRKWNPTTGHWEEVEEGDDVPVEEDEFCEKCKEDVLPDEYDCCPKCGGWIDTYEKGDVWNRGSGSTWGGSSYKPWWQKSTVAPATSYGGKASAYKPASSLSGSWSSWGYGGYGGYGAAGGIGTIGSSLGWSSQRTDAYEMMKYKNQLDSLCTIVDPLVKHHLIWNGMEDTNYSVLEKSLICLDGTRLLEDGEKHLDVASGLAIHEKLHLIHTRDLNDWQLESKSLIILKHGHWGWKLFLSICNVLEDEYIEKQLKKTCPGYIAYIQATKDFYWKKYEDELTNPEESDFGDLFNSFLLQVRYPSVLSTRQKGRWGKHLNAISGILKDKLHKDTRIDMMLEVFNYFMGLAIVMEEEEEDGRGGASGRGDEESLKKAIGSAEGAGIELSDRDKENISIALRLGEEEDAIEGLSPGERIIREMGSMWDIIKALLEGEDKGKINEDLAKMLKEMEDEDYAESKLSNHDALTTRQKKIVWRSVKPTKNQTDIYKKDRMEMLSEINKLRRKISLYGNPLPLTIRNQKRGKLDKRVLHRIPMDRTDLFNVRIIKQDNPVDICLLVDESGSMGWGKIEMARRAAIAMKEALQDNPKVQLWVFGHSADESGGGNTEMFEYSGPKMTDRPLACGAMRARYENRDGNAILASSQRVKEQSMAAHTQKLMIVFSDGQPSAQGYRGFEALQHTKKCVSKVENEGWDVIQVGFGVRKETMARMFKNYVQIEDMKYLANTLSKIIRRVLKI